MTPRSDEIIRALKEEKLFASQHYNSLGDDIFSNNHYHITSYVKRLIINLFNDFYYTEEMAYKTAKIIWDIERRNKNV